MEATNFVISKLMAFTTFQHHLRLFRPLLESDHLLEVQERNIADNCNNLFKIILELHKDISKIINKFKVALSQIDLALYNCLCLDPVIDDDVRISMSYIDAKLLSFFILIDECRTQLHTFSYIFEDADLIYLQRAFYAINNKVIPLIQRYYTINDDESHESDENDDDFFFIVLPELMEEFGEKTCVNLVLEEDADEMMSTPELLQSVSHSVEFTTKGIELNEADKQSFDFENLNVIFNNPDYTSITLGDIMAGNSKCAVCYEIVPNNNFIWSDDCNHFFCHTCTTELYKYASNIQIKTNTNNWGESEDSIAANCPMCRTLRFVQSLKRPAMKESVYVFKPAYVHN